MPDRPNFLFIITDQHKADHLGCYGNPMVRTPNIDSLSQNGLTFDSFYAASLICMPNRATLMTGRMPSCHGVHYNGVPLSADNITFVELLRSAVNMMTVFLDNDRFSSAASILPMASSTIVTMP